MRYAEPLVWGTLLVRYRRFLAEVILPDGEVVQAHVPNSGRMTGCSAPGSPCLLAPARGPRRRLAWTLEQVVAGGIPVGVNTLRANRLVEEALAAGLLSPVGLLRPFQLAREVRSGGCRFDFRLTDVGGGVWVEAKNITMVEDGTALFPDAVTARGARHLRTLAALAKAGERCVLVYVVQRGDAMKVAADARVDPAYTEALQAATACGVTAYAIQVVVAPQGLFPWRTLPVVEPFVSAPAR